MSDGREGRPQISNKDRVLKLLPELVAKQPQGFGWCRSTWSVELVALEVERQLGVRISRSQLGCLLRHH